MAARRNFLHAVQVRLVEEFSAEALRPVLQKRDVAAILVGGGAPCQGNTSLNRGRRGLQDMRTQAAIRIPLLAEAIAKLPEVCK